MVFVLPAGRSGWNDTELQIQTGAKLPVEPPFPLYAPLPPERDGFRWIRSAQRSWLTFVDINEEDGKSLEKDAMTLLEVTEAEKVEVMGDDPDELPLRSAAFTFFSPFLNYFVYLFFFARRKEEEKRARGRGRRGCEIGKRKVALWDSIFPTHHKIKKKRQLIFRDTRSSGLVCLAPVFNVVFVSPDLFLLPTKMLPSILGAARSE